MKKGQASTVIILIVVLAVIVTVVVVSLVAFSGPKTDTTSTYAPEDYGIGEYTPPTSNHDNSDAADFGIGEYNPPSTWCNPGETQSLEPLGVPGQLTINGMDTFQGQSLCKGTMVGTEGSAFLYTNEGASVWYITDEQGNVVLSYLDPSGVATQPETPEISFSDTCSCDGTETPESWCMPATWGGFTVCGVIGGGEGMCKTIVSDGKKTVIGYERNLDGVHKEVAYITDCAGTELNDPELLALFSY